MKIRDLESTWSEREALLLDIFHAVNPDVILVEMFPFGRKRFAREILPILEANRQRVRPAVTLCSLRDILVEKEDQAKFERNVLKWLNPYFDGVLVHSDPALIRLEQTFSRVADIACPVWYTGYVAQGPTAPDKRSARASSAWTRTRASSWPAPEAARSGTSCSWPPWRQAFC
jgi:Predicted glycosyl transferase